MTVLRVQGRGRAHPSKGLGLLGLMARLLCCAGLGSRFAVTLSVLKGYRRGLMAPRGPLYVPFLHITLSTACLSDFKTFEHAQRKDFRRSH